MAYPRCALVSFPWKRDVEINAKELESWLHELAGFPVQH